MAKLSEHSEALELIGYGLSKFAGNVKGKNDFANAISKNRNQFFQELVDLGIATSKNAVSTRQDNYDPLFENAKDGFTRNDIKRKYEVMKPRIDAVVGNLSFDEYIVFVKELIKCETGKTVNKEYSTIIDLAKKAVFSKDINDINEEQDADEILEEVNTNRDEGRVHIKIQWILIQLGKLTGCEVFVAKNDRGRDYQGNVLGKYSIDALPSGNLDSDVRKTIENIDIIWLKAQRIVCAFEVECTTSIFSGILRMSDLALTTYGSIKQYIIAPETRKDQVFKQFSRPTFCNESISKNIWYISTEELEKLYIQLMEIGLDNGSMKTTILDKIAMSLDKTLDNGCVKILNN